MKFKEYISESEEHNLIGMKINGREVTPDTKNQAWIGDFWCRGKVLTSLKGCPSHIGSNFRCNDNRLTSLLYGPKTVGREYWCNNNRLTSLEGCPSVIHGEFHCFNNNLETLKGGPKSVKGHFSCSNNFLRSLEDCPSILNGDFSDFICLSNNLTSLKDIHKMIIQMNGDFCCHDNPIESHVLGLLLIPGLKLVKSDLPWAVILNKYIRKGRAGVMAAQQELIEAGLTEYAQL